MHNSGSTQHRAAVSRLPIDFKTRFRLLHLPIKLCSCILLIATVVSFTACAEQRSAVSLMNEFADSYGVGGIVYSPDASEAEEGYIDEDFFETLYGDGEEYISDYSVLLLSGAVRVGECAVFLCHSDYDAAQVGRMCLMRIDLLRSVSSAVDTEFADDAFVLRSGRWVVMCALSDNEMARILWDRLL